VIEKPASFYDWLMLLNKHHLKVGPLEAFKDERFHHALSRSNSNISFGFWDHRTATGFLDMDNQTFVKEEAARRQASEWDVFGK
jgi:hypothetical protein